VTTTSANSPGPTSPATVFDAETERQAIAVVRGLAMDAPLAAKSGHQGTAMSLAPIAHVLYGRVMRHDPTDPTWADRDRFILSNGHASILQYSMLHLCGYGLERADLEAFRQWGSATPGHPEVGHTPGVEVTTGPLGQGLANAVGMAIAERHQRAVFGSDVVDHRIYVLAGDGCLMEGVSHEAASLAGHLGLGRLICVFDDNRITIDGSTDLTVSDDVPGRFRAYGWHVIELGEAGEDLDVLEQALRDAAAIEDRPSLVVVRTHIGFPSPDHTDRHEAHGNPFTAEDVARTKALMGLPDEAFHLPETLISRYRAVVTERGARDREAWTQRLAERRDDPDFAQRWDAAWSLTDPGLAGWDTVEVPVDPTASPATRQTIQAAMSATAPSLPGLIGGSADLTGNTGVKIAGASGHQRATPEGAQVYFGVREHAMGAAAVGMALHGGALPVIGTFFVFADYLRPALRLAALSRAKVVFVFSHDSVGVGEDGPTHQPVEHLATLRAIPGLHVIRPADASETIAAWRDAVTHDGPTAIVLSRQSLPQITDGSAVGPGAAPVGVEVSDPDVVLVGTGSEVSVCVGAAEVLSQRGIAARVVSMPSWDRFESRSPADIEAVLGSGVPVVSVEAATTFGWSRWADASVGIDRFGASAPGPVVMERLGISVDRVVEVAGALITARGARS
jgi:transketolase